MEITPVRSTDLPQILAIEAAGFTTAEQGTALAYRERMTKLATTFLVARTADTVLGFIVGPAVTARYIEDDMYTVTPTNLVQGGHQLVFTLAVAPTAQHQHVGSQLLTALATVAQQAGRTSMALTCLARLIPFYEQNGFKNQGVAASTHAGETWYNLEKTWE
ncbi:GNAT family N-acetyltransferase [Lactobacillus sp. CBA3606]|uniref:GNAT family N-acetyltransferase n=1 Tax=Lactobacillus sp. CBA3606 TaxID=2099789 RepID=UPI000CFB9133|nr:GNAT family N-acetyltransferase [Lactobacillus sp. CBA3606]AVK64311.1 GNAT family N-acetyltransferase [Lactobacillus sp. CBA3606]